MSNFKVGDRVKSLVGNEFIRKGGTGTVALVSKKDVDVSWDNPKSGGTGSRWSIEIDEIKLITPKNKQPKEKVDQPVEEKVSQSFSSPVPPDAIRKHPQLPDVNYVPIQYLEDTADVLMPFRSSRIVEWRVEVGNVVVVAEVCDSKSGVSHMGVGCALLEDMRDPFELQKKLPLAESLAYKGAYRKFGVVFGRDINRDPLEWVVQGRAKKEEWNPDGDK
jgi:hypothetical protein